VKRLAIRIGFAALTAFLALNLVAYRHAWRMTHFVPVGTRTARPGKLSTLAKIKTLIVGVEIPRPVVDAVNAEFPQPARTVHFTARDGVKLVAWDIPAPGEQEQGVMVMFHGHAVSRSSLLGIARVLHELGWRTVLVDFRGSGDSDGSATTLGWHEARDVAAAVNWSRHEWPTEKLVAFGESMGGGAVLRSIATEGVTPDGIVVEAPFDTLLTTVGHRYHAMGLPSFPFAQLLLLWGGVQNGFNAFALNPVDYATAVNCPALVLSGEHDPWVKPAEAQRVAAAMHGPTECHIFEKGGHCGFWWDVPDEYRRVVGEWAGSIARGKNSAREAAQSKNR
jgi:pimeloyl-ACP methyl ester carboxylesterase